METDADRRTRSLVERSQRGELAAFDELCALYRERLRTVVFFRLGAGAARAMEVDDVVQECFLRALASLERFSWQGDDAWFRWLRRIAEHVILEAAARGRRATSTASADVADERAASATSPSRELIREERFERLREALDELSPDHRQVILLARIEGLPIREIAARIGRSEDAVSNLLARALARLRRRFGETESFHLPQRSLLDPE